MAQVFEMKIIKFSHNLNTNCKSSAAPIMWSPRSLKPSKIDIKIFDRPKTQGNCLGFDVRKSQKIKNPKFDEVSPG